MGVYMFIQRQIAIDNNIYTSFKDELENGRKYEFFGIDKNTFDLQQYMDERNFYLIADFEEWNEYNDEYYKKHYNKEVFATTAKEAAEIAEFYYYLVLPDEYYESLLLTPEQVADFREHMTVDDGSEITEDFFIIKYPNDVFAMNVYYDKKTDCWAMSLKITPNEEYSYTEKDAEHAILVLSRDGGYIKEYGDGEYPIPVNFM